MGGDRFGFVLACKLTRSIVTLGVTSLDDRRQYKLLFSLFALYTEVMSGGLSRLRLARAKALAAPTRYYVRCFFSRADHVQRPLAQSRLSISKYLTSRRIAMSLTRATLHL